jgi:hypothetical protein
MSSGWDLINLCYKKLVSACYISFRHLFPFVLSLLSHDAQICAFRIFAQRVQWSAISGVFIHFANCTGIFTPVSVSAAFAALNPGWNLGNTLDATPDEGSWSNPPVKATTFSEVQAKGFKSVRIPGTCSGLGILPIPDNVQSLGRITSQIPRRHGMSILLG